MRSTQSPSASPPSGGYGRGLADVFGRPSARAVLNRTLKAGVLAATEVRDDAPQRSVSGAIPPEDAFLATLHLREIERHVAWEAGRQYPVETLRVGDTLMRDLKRDPTVLVAQPHHEIHFYLPRAALDAIADDCEARRVDELRYAPGRPIADPVIAGLGRSILGAFALAGEPNTLFLDHLLSAIATHLAVSAGGMTPRSRSARARLAPAQERRAKEMLATHLGGDLGLADLARQCGLSVSHFRRAFHASTGVAPHQWLIRQRLDAAKTRLRDSQGSLAEIALACGFNDQSHFTRVFSQREGVSPGRWRAERARRAAPDHEDER